MNKLHQVFMWIQGYRGYRDIEVEQAWDRVLREMRKNMR